MPNMNVYDVLHRPPRLSRRLKDRAQEALARAVVASGKLRIDNDESANFARLLIPGEGLNITVSAREFQNPALLPPAHREAVKRHSEYIRTQLSKRHGVSADLELKMARALVLCNAYPVIQLLHLEGAEIYISFGHSVGDVMDVASWQQNGENSGLQSIAGENAVYVSCGGNPFIEGEERRHTGDGFPAIARFMIIAAQETGHNGDLIRDAQGRHVGRFSAVGNQPSPKAGTGRRADYARTEALFQRVRNLGLNRLCEWERQLKFYRDLKVTHTRRTLAWLLSRLGFFYLTFRLKREGKGALATLQKNAYPATQLRTFFLDMLFNLAPQAEVYKRKSRIEEEAVQCIEALARVPQQAVKWGHASVKLCEPALYSLYYEEVVPACEEAIRRRTSGR